MSDSGKTHFADDDTLSYIASMQAKLDEANLKLQERDKCSYIGAMRDCPTHGDSAALKEANAKIAELKQQLRALAERVMKEQVEIDVSFAINEATLMETTANCHPENSVERDRLFARARSAIAIAEAIRNQNKVKE